MRYEKRERKCAICGLEYSYYCHTGFEVYFPVEYGPTRRVAPHRFEPVMFSDFGEACEDLKHAMLDALAPMCIPFLEWTQRVIVRTKGALLKRHY